MAQYEIFNDDTFCSFMVIFVSHRHFVKLGRVGDQNDFSMNSILPERIPLNFYFVDSFGWLLSDPECESEF